MDTTWVESVGIKCLPLAAVHTNKKSFHGAAGLFWNLVHCVCFIVRLAYNSH